VCRGKAYYGWLMCFLTAPTAKTEVSAQCMHSMHVTQIIIHGYQAGIIRI
jgi:hypothetical protein